MPFFENILAHAGNLRRNLFYPANRPRPSSLKPPLNKGHQQNHFQMMPLMEKLFPICRSITGDGFLESLKMLSEVTPLNILEYPTGQECFEWTVPEEWNIRDAYIKDSTGKRVIDFNDSGLHVVNYSVPVHKKISFRELKKHLYYLPDQPDAIPYRTSYYKRTWGFCLTYNQFLGLAQNQNAEYEICIDSDIKKGVLRIGEIFIPGNSKKEILISSHNDHPWQASDGLSGAIIATALAKEIKSWPSRKHSYRILILPATIGCITYIFNHPNWVENIFGGYVLACLGDPGKFNYKKSFLGDHEIDRAMILALQRSGSKHYVRDFWPWGGDETQYSSPGFRMPVGSLMRTPFMEYPEYHTSLDNLSYVSEEAMQGSLYVYIQALKYLEMNGTYKVVIKGEPKLDKHQMYVGPNEDMNRYLATSYFFHLSDGTHSLLDISQNSGSDLETLAEIAEKAKAAGLVKQL